MLRANDLIVMVMVIDDEWINNNNKSHFNLSHSYSEFVSGSQLFTSFTDVGLS